MNADKGHSVKCRNGHQWTPETTYVSPKGERRCRLCTEEQRVSGRTKTYQRTLRRTGQGSYVRPIVVTSGLALEYEQAVTRFAEMSDAKVVTWDNWTRNSEIRRSRRSQRCPTCGQNVVRSGSC